jgi:hypothetical protein
MARLSLAVADSATTTEVRRNGNLVIWVMVIRLNKNERSCYFATLYVTWAICLAFREIFLS